MAARTGRIGCLNDGALVLYSPTAARAAAPVDFSTPAGCERVCALHFESRAFRQQDVDMADAEGFSLSRKVRVRPMPGLSTGQLAQIGGTLHEIRIADFDGQSAYLYLESLETDGTVQLSTREDGRDAIGAKRQTWTEPVTAWCRKASWTALRSTHTPFAGTQPSLTVTLRRCDWGGGYERVTRDGIPHTVESVESMGEWVVVTATRREGRDGG